MLNGTTHWRQGKGLIVNTLPVHLSKIMSLCVFIIISSRPWTIGSGSLRRDTPSLARLFKEKERVLLLVPAMHAEAVNIRK
jgi:hypothetical protein